MPLITDARAYALRDGYRPSDYCGPRTLAGYFHDNAYRCDCCGGRFSDERDMETDDDGILYDARTCQDCADDGGGYAEHSTYHARSGAVVG